jgi:hypothetical protein
MFLYRGMLTPGIVSNRPELHRSYVYPDTRNLTDRFCHPTSSKSWHILQHFLVKNKLQTDFKQALEWVGSLRL